MKRVLVIGIGSLLMRDDGIGSRVVEAVKNSLREHGITSLAGETDFQCCFDEIKPDDFLILIDAVAHGKKPGSLEIMLMRDALENRGKLCAQHEFSLFDLVALHYPEIHGYFIGIEAAEIGLGLELSEPLRQSLEQICCAVLSAVLKIKEDAEFSS